MKFSVMQQVYIQSDTLNLGAPIGKLGYIVQVDRNADSAQPYSVRVPTRQKWYWLPECDLVSANEWLSKEADDVIQRVLLDSALERKDEVAFKVACHMQRGNIE